MSLWSRTDTSLLSRWWWTIDRTSLAAMLALAGLGLMLILAASPAIAARHGLASNHFIYRQLLFIGPGLVVLLGCSLLGAERIRRLALPVLGIFFVLLLATLALGESINGARRWLSFGTLSLQPSEFLKPAFVLVLAAILSARERLGPLARYGLAACLLLAASLPLIFQPDFGQTALLTATWGAMLFLAGLPLVIMAGLAGVAILGAVLVYFRVEHVAERVNGFLDPSSTDTYQVTQAIRAFRAGGLFGEGIGEGRLKWDLPDAHTDFIFAVAGEEFGVILCLVLVALFAVIVVRALVAAMREGDQYLQLAISGLVLLFALQALINLGVNVHLLPAKGMTLPFVSYGGSSLLAASMLGGLLLALTRRRITGGLPRGFSLAGGGA
jgi:cell division protein FtsW